MPHLQHTQKSPRSVHTVLLEWADAALPGVGLRASLVSVPLTVALWLGESVPSAPGAEFMPPSGSREFAHIHEDGSMHLCLPGSAERELFEGVWGEPHPLHGRGVQEMLAYAPRNKEELVVSRAVLAESYRYATGRDPADVRNKRSSNATRNERRRT